MGSYGSPELHPKLQQEIQPPPPEKNVKNKFTSKKLGIVAGIGWGIFSLISLAVFLLVLSGSIFKLSTGVNPPAWASNLNDITTSIVLTFSVAFLVTPRILTTIFLLKHKSPRMFVIPFGMLCFINLLQDTSVISFVTMTVIVYLLLSKELSENSSRNMIFLIVCIAVSLIGFIYYYANDVMTLMGTLLGIVFYIMFLVYVYMYNEEQYEEYE